MRGQNCLLENGPPKRKQRIKTCFSKIKILGAKKINEPTIDAPGHGRFNGIFGCRMNIFISTAQGMCTWVLGKC